MNRRTVLHATTDLSIGRFDHLPNEVHEDPDREVAGRWAIAFVESGEFDLEVDGSRQRLTAGSIFLTRPGLEFSCSHGAECPEDVCLSVGFEPGAVGGSEHLWARSGWAARRVPTPRLAYVGNRIRAAAGQADGFELERWALAGLSALEVDGRDDRVRGPYAPRRSELEAVVAACEAIEADPVARRSVAERAREVGLTSTRLTHAFRRYLGVSPHQYVVRWRLAAATALLDQGARVSDSCWRSGFENLSHYCRAFQRAFGLRASHWRALALSERRRKVQAFLRGHS